MNRPAGVQLVLFGPVPIHLGRRSAVTGRRICADCKGDLAIAGAWDRRDGCHDCPGPVESAPRWMTLGDALAMHEPAGVELGEAA